MRTLIYLGLVNSLRNVGRTLLTVVAMAIAAFMMTSSLTMGGGYTAGKAVEYRAYLGGDVLVYPTWVWPTETDVADLKPGQAQLATLPAHFGSPLSYFHPDFYASGYLTTAPGGAPTYSMFSSKEEMDRAVAALAARPEVSGIVPYEAVPVVGGQLEAAVSTAQGSSAVNCSLSGFFLRACPPNLLGDAGDAVAPPQWRLATGDPNPPDTVTVNSGAGQTLGSVMDWKTGIIKSGGRAVALSDGDELVAMVNRRAVIARNEMGAKSIPIGGEGQVTRLTLPRIKAGAQGQLVYDFSDPVTLDIRIVGTYDVLSRLYHWIPVRGLHDYEQLYLESPELLMPQAGLDRVLAAMGLPEGGVPPVGALTLRLGDQSKAEETVQALRQTVPDLSVVTVAAETSYANLRNLPETIYFAPRRFQREPLPRRQEAVPAEAGSIFGMILFGFAGLVAAGNTTLLVLSRRTEFAILKAIGLRSYEVAIMVMIEVLTLAVIGLGVGFAAGEFSSVPILLTNGVPWAEVWSRLVRDLGVVAGATLGCSVLFSLVPMSKTLRITVAEAMRGNE